MSGPAVDEPRAIRPGEELDLGRLAAWLEGAIGASGDAVTVEQFPGGHSNLTYLVRADGRELVLRRPPFGSKVKTAHDMGREFRILSRLAPVWPRAPRPVAFCEDESILGARFYLMERIAGFIPRKELPRELASDPAVVRRICEAMVDALVELHAIDWRAAGLGDFANPEGYLARQIGGWTRRWHDAKTDEIPALDAVAGWLAERLPSSPPASIIHNDFKHDNIILDPRDPTGILGVLDWEMSTIGDPLADLGTSLSYWIEASDPQPLQMFRFGPTTLPGTLSRAEFAARYAEKSGRDVSSIDYYIIYGMFKAAVVGQQIYYRFKQGLTRDERFAGLIHLVRLSAEHAQSLLR
jgi:aminoglycoside phosphotransferase (APT) family kinase protein